MNGHNTHNKKYKVCTECFTFNQESFIEATLDGFTLQETSFPVVTVVVDDASTDGTADIIRDYLYKNFEINDSSFEEKEYGLLAKAKHKENDNCFFVIAFLKENLYQKGQHYLKNNYIKEWVEDSDYLAFCEGDDYWVDSLKLQKQVDFLENNSDYSLVHTNLFINTDGHLTKEVRKSQTQEYEDVLVRTGIATLTVLMRTNIFLEYYSKVNPIERGWNVIGDSPIWKYAAYKGKIMLLSDLTSVYRFHLQSCSHSGDFEKKKTVITTAYNIKCFFNANYSSEQERERLQRIIDISFFESYLDVCVYFGKSKEAIAFLKEKRKQCEPKTFIHLVTSYVFLITKKLFKKIKS